MQLIALLRRFHTSIFAITNAEELPEKLQFGNFFVMMNSHAVIGAVRRGLRGSDANVRRPGKFLHEVRNGCDEELSRRTTHSRRYV